MSRHPLSSLTEKEILLCSGLICGGYGDDKRLRFKGITLHEPSKEEMKMFETTQTVPPRRAWVNYYIKGTGFFYETVVNLTKRQVESNQRVPAGFHGPCDDAEILEAERITLADPRVQAEIKKLQLPPGATVVCDPWIWGADGVADDVRQYQCYMYLRAPEHSHEPDSNHYAHPLSFSPVFDTVTMTVTRIEYLPTGAGFETKPTPTEPQRLTAANEYIPELNAPLRTDLKPLVVQQPEGASFTVSDDVIRWQKWEFRLSFNYREGMVLHKVSYDGRALFYRVSLSDMSVPYGDPRPPFHKKQAFDLGDTGAGLMANDLKLGCDCLGAIAYQDGLIADDEGRPLWKRNAVCIHEQDAGLLWKHTNYRTNRAALVRKRELVLQSIITVSNYEYILAFVFDQAGEMTYEVRATGILSTQPIDPGVHVPWGTVVHDGVLAAYHQHILSLRIDPELDGDSKNSLVYEETKPLPRDPKSNPHGNGYIAYRRPVLTSGGYDLESSMNRVYMIESSKVNPVNLKKTAYKIRVPPMQPLLADEDSFHYKRADFADHSIYVTKYRDHELFAGGQYTNQNRQTTGVRKWAARQDSVVDEDLVVWVQFGLQHVPRCEDFPVMPAEIIRVSLKPDNFFTKNPAIDVPPSTQASNRSTLIETSKTANESCDGPRL
ncbi:primary-amine oxidase [Capronia epimyces CBS 606.96]|uniref:Amine oxidase n=1 Tax=Capronia epimyces CBS 606.96 TaxID=1182542 RepID=W9XV04_9EURO|nr:primary-amine oxidase [Capronia epimyces CBS 606.96]EXJ84058.1 primary-amine oxidase [Capronia epimyces CBS 606.96]